MANEASDGQLKVQIGTSYDPKGIDAASNALKKFAADSLSYGGSIRKGVDITNGAFDALAKSLLVINGNAQVFGRTIQTDIATLNAYKAAINDLLAKGIKPTAKEITTLATQVEFLNKKIANSTSPFSKLGAGSNSAAFALTNLGRVAQDAPFGFIGIQNNLNPLLESFQRLRVEAGSSSAALKLLAGSLIGAGGLGLALSVVTSLYTLYVQYQQKSTKATKDAEDATKKAREELEKYIESLGGVDRSRIKGIENSNREILGLRMLYEATQNLKLPMSERVKAVNALQEQYPKTFSNFTDEQILLGKSSTAYKQLSADILAVAKAAAGQDIITENAKTILENSQKSLQVTKDRKKAEEELVRLTEKRGKLSAFGGDEYNNERAIGAEKRKITAAEKELVKLGNQRAILTRENLAIETEITKQVLQTQSVVSLTGVETGDGKKKEKSLKSLSDILAELNIELKKNELAFGETFSGKRENDVNSYQKAIESLVENGFKPAGKEVAGLIALQKIAFNAGRNNNVLGDNSSSRPKLSPGGVEIKPILGVSGAKEELTQLEEYINGLENSLYKLGEFPNILNTIGQALGGSFEAMGEAIVSGGDVLASAGKILQSLIGGIMSSIGQQFITLGSAKVAAGILASPFGGKLISQGTGLIALGAGLSLAGGIAKNIGSSKSNSPSSNSGNSRPNIPQFAAGGLAYGNTLAQVGEYPGAKSNPEVIAPLNKLKDIIGDRGSSVNINAGLSISGRDFVMWFKEQEALYNRTV